MLSIAQGVVQAKEQSREEEEIIWKKRTQKMDVAVKTVISEATSESELLLQFLSFCVML
jgi:hypothetical protein